MGSQPNRKRHVRIRLCGRCTHAEWQHDRGIACTAPTCDCNRFQPGETRSERILAAGSGSEGSRGAQLRALEHVGAIRDLREGPTYAIHPPGCERIAWKLDFEYVEDELLVVEDHKLDLFDDAFAMKVKLFQCRYPDIRLRITQYQRGRLVVLFERGGRVAA